MAESDIFPLGVDHSLLQITHEGLYSVTHRKDGDKISTIISNTVGNCSEKTITDATGCNGGDTIRFSFHFSHVYAIEIKEDNFCSLQHNIAVYNRKNITIYNQNSVSFFNWKTNVLYIDPPWGGPDYKIHKSIDVYMADTRLDIWLEQILLRKNRPEYIFLKLPSNYNFNRLNFLSNVDKIKPYRVRNYILIAITIHIPSLNKNQ